MVGKGLQCRRAGLEACRQQALENDQDGVNGLYAPSRPAQNSGQFDLRAQINAGGRQTGGLLHLTQEDLQLNEGTGEPRRQAIGQQADGGVTPPAIPAGDQRTGRGKAFIGAVTPIAAAAPGV